MIRWEEFVSSLSFEDLESLRVAVGGRVEFLRANPMPLNAEEQNAVLSGEMIQAIKLYRRRTGATLKDAKDQCDRYRGSLPRDVHNFIYQSNF